MNVSTVPPRLGPELQGLLAEFRDLADLIAMPEEERAGIAGLPVTTLQQLSQGTADLPAQVASRCARRLHYSLPLLRRIVENHPALGPEPAPRLARSRRASSGISAR